MISSTLLAAALAPLTFGAVIGEEQVTAAPELTMAVARQALEGWNLYQSGKVVSSFERGRYTDTNPELRNHPLTRFQESLP